MKMFFSIGPPNALFSGRIRCAQDLGRKSVPDDFRLNKSMQVSLSSKKVLVRRHREGQTAVLLKHNRAGVRTVEIFFYERSIYNIAAH
jgi:hypothetical protein